MQAQVKVEADAMAALEARFAAQDVELFRLLAERTLPEPPPPAAADESAAAARQLLLMGGGLLCVRCPAVRSHLR